MTTDINGRAHRRAGAADGGRFAVEQRRESPVSLSPEDVQSAADPGPPPGSWERSVSPYTGLVTYRSTFEVDGGAATHAVSGLLPGEQPSSELDSVRLGSGSITIAQGDRLPGELTYEIVDAPVLDGTGRRVKAIHVNWVSVVRNRGKGWASAMYASVRAAHPDCIIPAADVLEPPGRRLVKHYRDKHPQVHTGRFDSQGRIHPTSGPQDPAYRAAQLVD